MSEGYFGLEQPDDLTGWHTLADLAADRAVLAAKVAVTRTALGASGHPRIAASVDFLGLAARVVSPALRWAAEQDTVPVLDPAEIWWRPAVPGPLRLAMPVRTWRRARGAALFEAAVRPALAPLVRAYGSAFTLSRRVLWGNVASALNGAAVVLRTPRAAELVRAQLAVGELAGTARAAPPGFVRNSCCLYYRLPSAGTCGDCVLRTAPRRAS